MLGYDAARWHALLNDFPAALLVVAVAFDFAAATTKRESLMWAAIWTLWAGVIGGWVAVVAGKLASGSIEHGEAIHEIMEKHENMALITMSLFTVVLGWRLLRRFQMPFEHAAGIPSRTLQAEIENREEGHQHEAGKEHEHAADSLSDTTKRTAPHTHPPGTPPHSH